MSSVWTPRGKQAVVLLDPTPGLADAILSEVTDSQLLGRPAAESEARAIFDAMRTDHGGALRTPGKFNAERERVRERDIREFVSLSREFVTTPETQEKDRQRTESVIREVQRLLLIGAVVLAEFLAVKYLLPQGISLAALTLLAADNFATYTGNPHGQNMSTTGVWSVDAGTFNVTALAVCECNSAGDSYMRDSSQSPVDKQRTFIRWMNAAVNRTGGPMTRMDFGGSTMSGFQNFKKGDSLFDMYEITDDSYTLIAHDTTGPALSGGDRFWMGSDGTTQSCGPGEFGSEVTRLSTTDSNHPTGVGGVYGDVSTFDFNDYKHYTDAGSKSPPRPRRRVQHVNLRR